MTDEPKPKYPTAEEIEALWNPLMLDLVDKICEAGPQGESAAMFLFARTLLSMGTTIEGGDGEKGLELVSRVINELQERRRLWLQEHGEPNA